MNTMFKKSLVSIAVASLMAGTAFAATTVNTPTVVTHYSAGGDNNFTVNDINITETLISGVPASSTATLTITIPVMLY